MRHLTPGRVDQRHDNNERRRTTALVAAFLLLLAGLTLASCLHSEPEPCQVQVSEAVTAELEASGSASVLLSLARGAPRGPALEAAFGSGVSVTRRFRHVDAVAATIDSDALGHIQRLSNVVSSVELDRVGRAHLAETSALLRAPVVHEVLGFTGVGITVALLDSGIDGTHPDLAGRVVAEHCFTDQACDLGAGDGPSEGDFAFDDTGHGTHTAGVIAIPARATTGSNPRTRLQPPPRSPRQLPMVGMGERRALLVPQQRR